MENDGEHSMKKDNTKNSESAMNGIEFGKKRSIKFVGGDDNYEEWKIQSREFRLK